MTLLAKSSTAHGEKTLVDHTKDVLSALTVLFGTQDKPSRLAKCWQRFFGLRDLRAFFACVRIAAVFHDVGKANSGFQNAVRGDRDAQVVRHEHVSGLILMQDPWHNTIGQFPDSHFETVLSAVIGHHLQATPDNLAQNPNPNRRVFKVYAEGLQALAALVEGLDTGICWNGLDIADKVWGFGPAGAVNVEPLRKALCAHMKRFKRHLKNDDQVRRLTIAVRAALIVVDSAASGLTREAKPLAEWLGVAVPNDEKKDESTNAELIDGSYIEREVIQKRIDQIGKRWRGWDDFQRAADLLGSRALLIASCGSGKTLAAWRWIKARLEDKPAARVIFLYPTRATATEGFRDYVSWAPEADASLLHGTAAYELDTMFENPDERFEKDFTTEDRLFAIGYWQRRVFSATVDQFLGFMQHAYRSICLLPLLVDSVIVIDEVHSFDKSLFSALKAFLKFTGEQRHPPVLCMTASLPDRRKNDLVEECGLQLFPTRLEDHQDLRDRAAMPRYAVRRLACVSEAEQIASRAKADGKRVLWVVNTVGRCRELARHFNALCYHSRFKLDDRKERHNEVVQAFQRVDRAVLAITTQVCEMSLDLDADVLMTEAAPITSLIQRMGRCNRQAQLANEKLGEVYIYEPANLTPYRDEDWHGVAEFLADIDDQHVSQVRLQELLEEHGPVEVEVDRYAAFLESGPWASSREESLREIQEFTVPGILDCDISRFMELRKTQKAIDGLIVPVPRRFSSGQDQLSAQQRSGLPRHLTVVPSDCYDARFGLVK